MKISALTSRIPKLQVHKSFGDLLLFLCFLCQILPLFFLL
ncbi:hypothetical protein LEP1GSC171_2518 [Leptospira santarosai str. HAI1380]|uniref:Uncharacterized protein n=2 Tax=Leptospira santarosai TaxID=28183 RepID=M6UMG1_9LEPT|nr:hypothetical protein LEP1GSC005_0590 [Leptospira santarosai str. ST188]EMJ51350.1 hypothetical protein LEP1GSC169_0288 [Leptospira santarosai str. HAI1349]EMM78351.1 hypothetical protein LEP1GSC040_2535 [Leptospira santarosai str. 2000030832]EMN19784.1 hypothetical protein LEP1GSC063_2207 [Leptospira santarosai serovar Arenal str. MAVJ 401]EMO30757.1 hypothetical protein LEP1GSC175_3316 [Leptospira santarosai str. HAI821]EMO46322.1 hypothetical protein LEP1GSC187_0966 [Leptospira santarosai